ncbi:MAG: excinuclease ABC subunit UvrB [Acidobacteriota bacterium]|nr:excinuclease ABC subunit UvrB [Acidobacteriota bacterium]MDE3043412.1 excinuclease ABC subunit UvrB [Acidobacteriota bacterium]MDE3221986.1 excinuclease ABC subunit UvrB [Acidobacteriota bacterium]
MTLFKVESPFSPAGDQPAAIAALARGVDDGLRYQTLEGITGSGKTATIAWLIERVQRPTLILEPNKSLAAQLASELRDMLPSNRVEFFVSYYDYYQPEAYIPRTDTYIEKDSSVNEEIDRLRHAATSSLLTHRDTVVVASVSCIYGLGSPLEYRERMLPLEVGLTIDNRWLLRRLVEMQYNRNELVLERGSFRMKGDTLEIQPAYSNEAVRVSFFGDEIEEISFFNPLTQESRGKVHEVTLFAASHYATSAETLQRACRSIEEELQVQLAAFQAQGKLLEAQRLRSRTEHDLEMLEQTGICAGIENYSAHLDGRSRGERPFTLLDYFPSDFLVVIDESHVAVPQVRGQFAGDKSRKETLVEHGFRLPSALDNRPLNFEEFIDLVPQIVFVSATPGPYEEEHSDQVVEQVIRPTGLLDPEVLVVPTKDQIEDLRGRLDVVIARGERALITTLTKKMAEDLTTFLTKAGYRVQYLHSDIDTIQRIEILRSLRLGEFDVLVGINLLREGLDLPEVSLVAILDADKEGFLRSRSALIQTIGRAARNSNGLAVLYADRVTDSMRQALSLTERRRRAQIAYNTEHGIEPKTVMKNVADILGRLRSESVPVPHDKVHGVASLEGVWPDDLSQEIARVEKAMLLAADDLRFEEAAALRDLLHTLQQHALDGSVEPVSLD